MEKQHSADGYRRDSAEAALMSWQKGWQILRKNGHLRCEEYARINSTQSYLWSQPMPVNGQAHLCCAHSQEAGRGRHGRTWHSWPGGSILFSILRPFPATLPLSTLALAVGIRLALAFRRLGIPQLLLKWPNDLVLPCGDSATAHQKLAGILLEQSLAEDGRQRIVCGIGINYRLPVQRKAERYWVCCEQLLATLPCRQQLSHAMAFVVLRAMDDFEQFGWPIFQADWPDLDALFGHLVAYQQGQQWQRGRAAGIAASGALIIRQGGHSRLLHGGTVRLVGE